VARSVQVWGCLLGPSLLPWQRELWCLCALRAPLQGRSIRRSNEEPKRCLSGLEQRKRRLIAFATRRPPIPYKQCSTLHKWSYKGVIHLPTRLASWDKLQTRISILWHQSRMLVDFLFPFSLKWLVLQEPTPVHSSGNSIKTILCSMSFWARSCTRVLRSLSGTALAAKPVCNRDITIR
jgi:hypothetical protein